MDTTIPKREEWEIREDLQAIQRAIEVFKDKGRLKDVQDHIKAKKAAENTVDAVVEGDLSAALGFMQSS